MSKGHAIVIRTKADHSQGLGDLMGSICVAEELVQCGVEVTFLVNHARVTREVLNRTGFRYRCYSEEEDEFERWGLTGDVNVAVVNQMSSPHERLATAKLFSKALVTIDDVGASSRRLADYRINPLYYDLGATCGFPFVPIQRCYREKRAEHVRARREIKRVGVCLGGSDTYGFTPLVVSSLSECKMIRTDVEITIVCGPAYTHDRELEEALSDLRTPVRILHGLGISEMCEVFSSSDVVITSGGLTMCEAACLGRPTVVVCNERFEEETAKRLADEGACLHLGYGGDLERSKLAQAVDELISNHAARQRLATRAHSIIDGEGAKRISQLILCA